MNERLHITLCKGSKPGDYERYSLARLPVPGGARRGKSEQIFLSHSGVTHALGRLGQIPRLWSTGLRTPNSVLTLL